MKYLKNICLLTAVVLLFTRCEGKVDYADLPNPLQGSDSKFELSTGNTYPAIALPWGMNFWTAQTGKMGNGWQYTWQDTLIRGFKQTHQPSPWIADYGCFSIMPIVGNLVVNENLRASEFSHNDELSKAYYYSVVLKKYDVKTEMTPTNSGVAFKFTFPKTDDAYILVDGYKGGSYVKVEPDKRRVVGYAKYYAPNCDANLPDNFATYFVVQFDRDFDVYGTWEPGTINKQAVELGGNHVGSYLKFKTKKGEAINVKVASSFISLDQAELNLNRELGGKSFEQVKTEAKTAWNEGLGRIKIKGGTLEQKRTFYTALYRTMLFPRKFHEYDKNGDMVHYSAMNGKVEKGPMYTDNGFWDTFRAVHPFFTIMYPDMSGEIMQALLNYYKEGGWMPEWFSPGYKNCMIGQHSASIVADAYIKGIRNFDVELAWEAIVKGANNEGPITAVGRDGCKFYNKMGYVPFDVKKIESVSKTMEYAYDDFCISTLAKAIGKPQEVVDLYAKRAMNYKNVFDKSINFVRPKDKNGKWQNPFRPDSWGGSFTEGSSWHWTWSVFHDPQGLIDLMGGKDAFIAKLDSVFIAEPTFDYTAYGQVIHEMTEMVLCNMGQYAHGNQPIQHAIYLYNYAGVPYKAQKWVRHTMDTQYHSGVDGLCGDEDNGQTSAWYVFSALGFYPVCPGQPEYVIGSPLFEEAEMVLPNGKTFTVKAKGNNAENVYIQSASLNGQPLNRTYITYDEIMGGGALEFVMASTPNKEWASSPDAAPFSMSKN